MMQDFHVASPDALTFAGYQSAQHHGIMDFIPMTVELSTLNICTTLEAVRQPVAHFSMVVAES